MMDVIRKSVRLPLFVVALVVVLASCGGGPAAGDAITIGDEGVSFEQLADLAGVLDPSSEIGGTADAEAMRQAAGIWVQTDAIVRALDEIGISMTDQAELAAEQLLARSIADGTIGQTTPSSPSYDQLVEFAWVQTDPEASAALQSNRAVSDRMIELLGERVETSSQLGSWDTEAFRFVGPSGALPGE